MHYMSNTVVNKIILFILNPFISAIVALKNIRDGVSHRILYLWFLVFGAALIPNEELDAYRYYEQFVQERAYSWERYISSIKDYFSFNTEIKDIYTLTINFLVGNFTDNYHWAFFVYSIVFGIFYIKSLKIFLEYDVDKKWVFYALLFMFCFNNPILNVNGVRFWTAAWIGIYVTLSVIVKKDYKKVLLMFLTPLIHGSFFIWIGIFFIAVLTFRFVKIWIVLFILSSFISAVSYLNVLDDYTEMLPVFMQNMVYSYTQADRAVRIMSGQTSYGEAYADFLNALPGYFAILLTYMLIAKNKVMTKNSYRTSLWGIYLALASMTNFLSSIPSVGRFRNVVLPLLLLLWVVNYKDLKCYNKIFLLIPFIYFYSVLYWYRRTTWVMTFDTFLLPAPASLISNLYL